MATKIQFILGPEHLLRVAGHVPESNSRLYIRADPNRAPDVLAIESIRTSRGGGTNGDYTEDIKKVFRITEAEIFVFLQAQGETLPPNPIMFLRGFTQSNETIVHEIVVAEDTIEGRV